MVVADNFVVDLHIVVELDVPFHEGCFVVALHLGLLMAFDSQVVWKQLLLATQLFVPCLKVNNYLPMKQLLSLIHISEPTRPY